jgi:APA family basic amino acid/polyamine antiporter
MSQQEKRKLSRSVSWFGAFSVGYADVGADVLITLGLVALYAQHLAPFAMAAAAVVYVLVGLTYAKLSGAYPRAGGAQNFAFEAFGSLHSFVAGWGLLLDYMIDVALFSLAAVGYLGYFLREILGVSVLLSNPWYALAGVCLIAFLATVNLLGVKYSSRLNEALVVLSLATLALVLGVGGALHAYAGGFTGGRVGAVPPKDFLYAITIAMASFVGVEAASQLAEEVVEPERNLPRAIRLAVAVTVAIALAGSAYYASAVGSSAEAALHPLASLARCVPVLGPYLALWTGLVGFLLNLVSANAGVIGSSRVAFSMARDGLLPSSLAAVNRRQVPAASIIVFSGIASTLLLANALLPSVNLLDLVASLYNFGALVAYMYAALALYRLSARLGGSVTANRALGLSTLAACALMLSLLIALHEEGRILAAAWFASGIALFAAIEAREG